MGNDKGISTTHTTTLLIATTGACPLLPKEKHYKITTYSHEGSAYKHRLIKYDASSRQWAHSVQRLEWRVSTHYREKHYQRVHMCAHTHASVHAHTRVCAYVRTYRLACHCRLAARLTLAVLPLMANINKPVQFLLSHLQYFLELPSLSIK